jgi:6-phosphogluconolactonase/glucosamine-6-phosphate isomerase/deaminase
LVCAPHMGTFHMVHIYLQRPDRIKTFAPTPQKPFVLGLPTGSSPEGIYKRLVRRYKSGEISFQNVITFNMVSR